MIQVTVAVSEGITLAETALNIPGMDLALEEALKTLLSLLKSMPPRPVDIKQLLDLSVLVSQQA